MNRNSKRGITLVELVVAMTLTSIFAVLCVALINPIERTYRGTLKLARAQLLADTIVDSIRKECDDVKHDEKTSVWIGKMTSSDDADLINKGPGKIKASSGNVLVFQRNSNYTEAIYSGAEISDTNITNVENNPLTPSNTVHSIKTMEIDDKKANLKSGIVHFGYYQAREDDEGIFPIQSYDYTNPVLASTYGDFKVDVSFKDLTFNKTGAHPVYVMCTVKVLEKGTVVYTRTAVVSFSANGSGSGSGSGPVTPTGSPIKNVKIRLVWVNDKADKRPADGITVALKDDSGVFLGSYKFTNNELRKGNEQQTMIHLDKKHSVNLSIDPVKVSGYEYTITRNNNGFKVTLEPRNNVTLIPGPDFNSLVKDKGITHFIFGSNADLLSKAASGFVANVSCEADGSITPDYKLYIVNDPSDGTKTAYVLSDSGTFIGNKTMKQMFANCSNVVMFTGINSIDTSNTDTMYQVFINCRALSMEKFEVKWNTSKVETMDGMFRNVACAPSVNNDVTIDISSFDFSSCRNVVNEQTTGINKMFWTDAALDSHITTIRFPADKAKKNMSKLDKLQEVFSGCDHLKNLENFNDFNFSAVKTSYQIFNYCTALEEVDFSNWNLSSENFTSLRTQNTDLFKGLTNVKKINLSGLSIPNVTDISSLFGGMTNLEIVILNKLNAPNVTSLNSLFSQKNKLQEVYLNNVTICSKGTWTAEKMFFKCFALNKVEMNSFVNERCTSLKSMFEECTQLGDISGLKSWTTTSVTNFYRLFYKCGSELTDDFEIDISGFGFNNDEDKSIDMGGMFSGSGASKIKFPKINGINNATSIDGMFQNCKKLSEVENFILNTDAHTDEEAPEFSFPKLTGLHNLFTYCSGLTNVKMKLNIPACTEIGYLFSNCGNLASLDISGSDFSGCTNISNFLNSSSAMKTLYMNEVDLSNCKTADAGFNDMFKGAPINYLYMNRINLDGAEEFAFLPYATLKELYLQEASLAAMTVLEGRFKNKTNVELIDISDAKFGAYNLGDSYLSASQMFIGCTKLKTIIAKNFKVPKNISEMFSGCTSLTSIDFTGWDTSKATTMKNMFFNCSSMTSFDNLSLFDTSKVETMEGMFDGCSSAKGFNSATWEGWNTSNVKSMKNMFHNFCNKSGDTAQYTIDISNFDFSNVQSFYEMFNCDEKNVGNSKDLVTKIVLPMGDKAVVKSTAGSTVTYRMFRNRWHLTTIQNLEYFNFEVNNTDAQSTFAGTALTVFNLRSMNFDRIVGTEKAQWMFNDNSYLTTIYVNPNCDYAAFASRNGSKEMFKGDKNLKGQNNTVYVNDNYRLGSYARIDVPGTAGFFSVEQ